MTWEIVDIHILEMDKAKKTIKKNEPCILAAALDLKLIETIVMSLDERELKDLYHDPDFTQKFSSLVYYKFKGK